MTFGVYWVDMCACAWVSMSGGYQWQHVYIAVRLYNLYWHMMASLQRMVPAISPSHQTPCARYSPSPFINTNSFSLKQP